MVCHRAALASRKTEARRWPSTREQSGRPHRDYLCATLWHPLGDASARNGLRQWHDLLAASPRLAEGRSLAPDSSSAPRSAGWCRS